MSDYPKIMTRAGVEVSVGGATEEAEKRADGWCSPLDGPVPEPVAAVETQALVSDPYDTEPTFGPPGDDTHAKRAPKGKKR
jgi:hypothetical protein